MTGMGKLTPSFVILNERYVLNERSELAQSIGDIRQGEDDAEREYRAIRDSVDRLSASLKVDHVDVSGLVEEVEWIGKESAEMERKMRELDERLERICEDRVRAY